jgi:hypothetical protein
MASKVTLGRNDMIAMLGDPEFFNQTRPLFAWLRDYAVETHRRYRESASDRCCGGDWAIMRPVVDVFFEALQRLQSTKPEKLKPVRHYAARKQQKHRDSDVTIIYRASREQKTPEILKF